MKSSVFIGVGGPQAYGESRDDRGPEGLPIVLSGDQMFDDVVTRYVRGEAREDALEDIGAILLLSSRSFDESGGRGQHVNVSLPDIAKGALRNYHDPVARHLWSIIVYHASFIEYDNESETGDFVVEILWDMAFNNPISPERVVGLQKIAESEP